MTNAEEQEQSGEMINDAMLMTGGEDEPVEIIRDPVFISKHWFPSDGQMHD